MDLSIFLWVVGWAVTGLLSVHVQLFFKDRRCHRYLLLAMMLGPLYLAISFLSNYYMSTKLSNQDQDDEDIGN